MIVRKRSLLLVVPAFILALCSFGCTLVPKVPIASYTPPAELSVPSGMALRPVAFNKVIVDIGRSDVIGAKYTGYSQDMTAKCNLREPVKLEWNHSQNQMGLREHDGLARAFYSALERKGYPVVWNSEVIFDPQRDRTLAELSVSARIYRLTTNVCHHYSGWDHQPLHVTEAETDIYVEWFVYDEALSKDVLTVKTRGYVPPGEAVPNGDWQSIADAFSVAARELANSPEFLKVVEDKDSGG